ncbi:MAG TPA: YkvA family protein [Methyloceanibacter sp.]|nr:YkvA family protein [Methyloceanibacter sp.]
MIAWNDASALRQAALGRELRLSAFAKYEQRVRRDFWAKLKRFAGNLPFVEDTVAAYYCALDPATPMRVRGMLLATLAYFILPVDIVPDIILGLGFADDAALLTAVIGLVATNITPTHRAAAARALGKELPPSS